MNRMNMREDMLTLPEGTVPSNQNMTRFQNRLKAKKPRENYSRDSSWHWKSRVLWCSLVQEVVVNAKGDIHFIFKNGFEIKVR